MGEVFTTSPRDGSTKGTLWLPRHEPEQKLEGLLGIGSLHICIDGPTGTGKSSLAITQLRRARIPYNLVQITHAMSLEEFCSCISERKRPPAEISMKSPLGEATIKFNESSSKLPLTQRICRYLAKKNRTLLIDDFENAGEDLITGIADICKLLTERHTAPDARVIVVGTYNIFNRLLTAKPSLDSRIKQISLGTFKKPDESWKLLKTGFENLGLWDSSHEKTLPAEDLERCIRSIIEAAGHIPKSLNDLGREIARRKSHERDWITVDDIVVTAKEIAHSHESQYREGLALLLDFLGASPAALALLKIFWRSGIGQIYSYDFVASELRKTITQEKLDEALAKLVDMKFLARTGKSGDVLFVVDPVLAHLVYLVSNKPSKPDSPQDMPYLYAG